MACNVIFTTPIGQGFVTHLNFAKDIIFRVQYMRVYEGFLFICLLILAVRKYGNVKAIFSMRIFILYGFLLQSSNHQAFGQNLFSFISFSRRDPQAFLNAKMRTNLFFFNRDQIKKGMQNYSVLNGSHT